MLFGQILIIIVTAIVLVTPSAALAGFNFTVSQNSIGSDQELELSTQVSKLRPQAIYYLEGAFKKVGAKNYFGLTWVDPNWVQYTASDYSALKQIKTDVNGGWSGIVKVKIDSESKLFTGSGDYELKLKRFTENGSGVWSENAVVLYINAANAPDSKTTPSPGSNPEDPSSPRLTTLTVSSIPASINSNQPFALSVELKNGQENSVYYLKGAFLKSGSKNYFGKTKISGNWVKNGSVYSSQLKITTDSSGNWSGDIEVMPDAEDSGFTGSGDYNFKIGRYTAEGSGPDWSNEQTLNIINSVKNSSPTSIVTAINAAKLSPRPEVSRSGSPKASVLRNIATVAGVATTPASLELIQSSVNKPNYLFIVFGLVLLIAGLVPIVKLVKRG